MINNNNIFNDLTILMQTYERPLFAKRFMRYWSNKNIKIIIIDGGKKSIEDKFLKTLSKNINYFHLPKDYYSRMIYSTSLINTKFVLQACDDEFYITSAIKKCLELLNYNNELVSCGGCCMGFDYLDKKIIGNERYLKLQGLKLDNLDPMKRLLMHFSNYVPAHLYSVCRSDIWKIAVNSTFSKEYNFFAALELQMEMLIISAGKSMIIPELFWLRSSENKPINNTSPSFLRENTLESWWINNKFYDERNDFFSRMNLAKDEMNKLNNIKHDINFRECFDLFIKKNNTSQIKNLVKSNLYKYEKLYKFFSKFKKIFLTMLEKKPYSFYEMANYLKSKSIKIDYLELDDIYKQIESFHKIKI